MFHTNYSSTQMVALDGFDNAQHWTTADAAAILDIPERRIRRLLQRGILSGYKVRGRCGDEWRIYTFDPKQVKALLSIPNKTDIVAVGEHFCADPVALDSMQKNLASTSDQCAAESLNLESNSADSNPTEDKKELTSDNFWFNACNFIKMMISTIVRGKKDHTEDYAPIP